MHFGVFRVGPVESPFARELAAVLACGGTDTGAAVSHWNAAGLREIAKAEYARGRPIDIVLRREGPGRRSGVSVHCYTTLRADEVSLVQGVPVTTVERTLLDLAAVIGPAELERLVAHAERDGRTELAALPAIGARHPRHRGLRNLAGVIRRDGGPRLTRSEAETRLLALIRDSGLPVPVTNTRVRGIEVDFLWQRQRLIVEVDGFAYHSSPRAFQLDRRRDATLTAAGFRVIRLTWQQIKAEPGQTLVALAQALVRFESPASAEG
jgi:very-short-patch-repair endonuclease